MVSAVHPTANKAVDGTPRKSVLDSKLGSGLLIWDIEYARRHYYLDDEMTKRKKSPDDIKYTTIGTGYKWFERAKVVKLKEWEALANREYSK